MTFQRARDRAPSIPLCFALLCAVTPLGCGSPEPTNATSPLVDAGPGVPGDSDGSDPVWTSQDAGLSATFVAVWGSSGNDIYAVGSHPAALVHSVDHGAHWSSSPAIASTWLNAVGGSGPDDVYVVGDRTRTTPLILHSGDRGATWQSTPLTFAGHLGGVWSSGPNDTYAVGESNGAALVMHTSDRGATWTKETFAQYTGFEAVWGSGPGDIYAAGSTDDAGDAGSALDGGPSDGGGGGGDSGTLQHDGAVFHSSDAGRTWSVVAITHGNYLFAISGTADGARIDAVGAGFAWIESTDHGATWTQYGGGAVPSSRNQLTSVWLAPSAVRPFISGGEQGILRDVQSSQGATITSFEQVPQLQTIGVWGTGNEVFAVGDGIARRTGSLE